MDQESFELKPDDRFEWNFEKGAHLKLEFGDGSLVAVDVLPGASLEICVGRQPMTITLAKLLSGLPN